MKIRFLYLLFLVPLVITETASCTRTTESTGHSFSGLKTFVLYERPEGGYFPSDQISYDPSISKVLNESLNLEYNHQGVGGVEISRVLLTQIDRNSQERFFIDFDPGASTDPVFSIAPFPGKRSIGTIEANQLVLPGNGYIYSVARINKNFLERRKFAVRKGELIEIRQPFLFVGLDGKTKVDLELRSQPSAGEVVASIRKGDEVRVVLYDGQHYLVRSAFGLLGWVKLKDVARENAVIEGLFYAGD